MITETIVSFGFGLIYIFYPQYLVEEYLVDKTGFNDTARIIGLHYGSLMCTVGIIAWLARNAQPSIARRSITLLTCLSCIWVIFISFYALANHLETEAIWLTIIILAIMATWAGYLLWKEKDLSLN